MIYYLRHHIEKRKMTALIAIVTVSWIITLVNKLKYFKRQHKRDVEYAYKIVGEPIIATKKVK